ncbi:MAG: NAD(P)H-hydrate dehydratase [Clostridiales bacterium]|nr:NAD(P)H-hydrate dehydratase [Clostridiales bacterium]
MKACFSHQMREIDKRAAEEAGIPSIILMENAAIACVLELFSDFSDLKERRVSIFCGKGNNGGDGLAIARQLINRGVNVTVYLVCGNDYKGDALVNYEIIKNMGADIRDAAECENIGCEIRSYDIVIDAIFGTGIHGEISDPAAKVIDEINKNARYVMSVDIPSGLNADTGEICGVCIRADKTVTFAAYKVGMFMYPGADCTGKITVSDISIPRTIADGDRYGINVTDKELVRKIFPKRKNNSQKGDYGKLLIIAGSAGMSGAAYLCAQAALVSGSGLVTLAVPDCINTALESKTTEVMTLPLESQEGHLSQKSVGKILEKAEKCDAVLIGPGLGVSGDVMQIIEQVLNYSSVPVIIDADAINSISKNPNLIKNCACDLVFTPHAVEMSRLTGLDLSYIESNRLDVSSEFAQENGAAVILKGHHTIVTAADGVQYINNTGNPGLASGGSGDVLAGIVASLVPRCADTAKAAAAAVYIHGMAGDIAAQKYGMESVCATKLLECIPEALKEILNP